MNMLNQTFVVKDFARRHPVIDACGRYEDLQSCVTDGEASLRVPRVEDNIPSACITYIETLANSSFRLEN